VPTPLGAHSARLELARELLSKKGRTQHGRFSFEGPTLLREAHDAGISIESLYATQDAYDSVPLIARLEAQGVPAYIVEQRAMRRISDVETPSGIVAVAPLRLRGVADILHGAGIVLLLADVADPGNVGTLLRAAEAFGVRGVIAGSLGAELYLPKVVRSAMGALFRVPAATADPEVLEPYAAAWPVTGLSTDGLPLPTLTWGERAIIAVGSERHGLGRWGALCARLASIPMTGKAESLNAAVAGSIALYEAVKPAKA